MIVRPAQIADVPAVAAILAANDEPMDWPDLPALGWPYLEHLVARARTAVAVVDERVVGFGGSVPIGGEDVRFLTDLFVAPDRQSRGAGRALLCERHGRGRGPDDVLVGRPARARPVHPGGHAAVVAAALPRARRGEPRGGRPRRRDRSGRRRRDSPLVARLDRRGPLDRLRALRVPAGSRGFRRARCGRGGRRGLGAS